MFRVLIAKKFNLNGQYRNIMATLLPSLPKNVISEFGTNLKTSIENQISSLVDHSVANESGREASFQKVKKYNCNNFTCYPYSKNSIIHTNF